MEINQCFQNENEATQFPEDFRDGPISTKFDSLSRT